MKNKRITAVFLRMVHTMLIALLSFIVINPVLSANINGAGAQLNCNKTDLRSDINATFVANWAPLTYKVTYKCDDAGKVYFNENQVFDAEYTAPSVNSKCSTLGLIANGWSCKRTDNGTSVDSVIYENNTVSKWDIDSDVVCVAQWTEKNYNIVYKEIDENGSEQVFADLNESYTLKQLPFTVSAKPAERKGYDFVGWCSSNAVDADCSLNPVVNVPSETEPGQITVYWAKFNLKKINCESGKYLPAQSLKCDICPAGSYCEGGNYEYSDKDNGIKSCPTKYPLSASGSQNIGDCYHQCGFDFDDDTTGVFADGTDTCKYPIIYELNGGQFNPDNYPKYYEHGSGSLVLANPTMPEYTFGGWYANEDMTASPISAFDTNRTGPVYLYAKWDFLCASGKWLHFGLGDDDKVCLYKTQPSSPAITVEIGKERYYIMLSEDANVPVHEGSSRKMHVEIGGKTGSKTYNAHDFSVN